MNEPNDTSGKSPGFPNNKNESTFDIKAVQKEKAGRRLPPEDLPADATTTPQGRVYQKKKSRASQNTLPDPVDERLRKKTFDLRRVTFCESRQHIFEHAPNNH